MRTVFAICGIVAILIAGLWLWGWIANEIQAQEIKPWQTYSRLMYLVSPGCDEYKKKYGTWPSSLTQLRELRPDLNEASKDVWGRDVVLVPYDKSLGYGEIISYGRDGKPGGTGANRDLIVRFPEAANTSWNEQMGAGLRKPQRVP